MNFSTARSNRGLSIVELVVALALLSAVAFGIYESFLAAGRGGRHAEMRVRRDLYAQQALAELLAAPYAKLAAWTPAADFGAVPGYDDFLLRHRVDKVAGDLLRVTVEIAPPDPDTAAALQAEMLTVSGVKAP